MNTEPSVFIAGTQRSGTTLLCRILSIHPDLVVLNEELSIHELDEILILSKEQCLEELRRRLTKRGIVIEKKIWGIKHPYFTNHLENLKRLFPDAKIIIIMRDGRAVGSSYLKNKWGITNIYYGAKTWKSKVLLQKKFMERYPGQFYFVKYEDIVTHPEEKIREICSFLNLEYDKELLEYYKYPLPFQEKTSNTNVKKPLDPAIIHKWQTQLTPQQINIFETIAGDTLQEYGYELIGEKIRISPFHKAWFWFQQAIVGELQIQYQWRIKRTIRKRFEK